MNINPNALRDREAKEIAADIINAARSWITPDHSTSRRRSARACRNEVLQSRTGRRHVKSEWLIWFDRPNLHELRRRTHRQHQV